MEIRLNGSEVKVNRYLDVKICSKHTYILIAIDA